MNTSTDAAAAPAGSRIIAALEAAWHAIRTQHPDVPPVVIITGTGQAARGYATLGHFGANRWRISASDRRAELFIAGELLAGTRTHTGGHAVLETLLHEAAHGLAHTRSIKDCSRQNRYHNRHFARLAEELGLTPPTTPDAVLGFSSAALSDTAAEPWAHVIDAIDTARLPHLTTLALTTRPEPGDDTDASGTTSGRGGRAGTRLAVTCQCPEPRTLSITPRQYETAPLICGACMAPFTAAT